jgi:hypothetical protein
MLSRSNPRMARKEKLTLTISLLALVFSSIALFKENQSAIIDIEVDGSTGFLSNSLDSNFVETLTIPILFTNSTNNIGTVRKVSLFRAGQDTLVWRHFKSDHVELHWPKEVSPFTKGVTPEAHIINRIDSYAHPFIVGGQEDEFHFIEFYHDKSSGFFEPNSTYKLLVETSSNSIERDVSFRLDNENGKGEGSYFLIKSNHK